MVAAREAWADAGAPEVEPAAARRRAGDGHRRRVDAARRLRHAQGLRPAAGAADDRADADAERRRRRARRSSSARAPGAHAPVSACASGAEAMAYALDMIRTGRADVVIAGGTEAAIHPLPIAGLRRDAGAVDPQRHARDAPPVRTTPAATGSCSARAPASWCWSRHEYAEARGAKVYAELVSAGLTSDAHHIAAPDPGGPRRHPGDEARRSPTAASAVTRSCTSTRTRRPRRPATSPSPPRSRAALGEHVDGVAVSATKSMTGPPARRCRRRRRRSCRSSRCTTARPRRRSTSTDKLDPAIDLDVVVDKPREHRQRASRSTTPSGSAGTTWRVAFRTRVVTPAGQGAGARDRRTTAW